MSSLQSLGWSNCWNSISIWRNSSVSKQLIFWKLGEKEIRKKLNPESYFLSLEYWADYLMLETFTYPMEKIWLKINKAELNSDFLRI